MSRTPLGEVRGLGPAREGAEHWGLERAVSVATLLLLVWLAVSLWRLPGLDHLSVTQWLTEPLAAAPMLLLVIMLFEHLRMGLIVVVEDYVHEEGSKLLWVMLINFASIAAGALAFLCVLKIALANAG